MNVFHFDNGASAALALLNTFSRPNLTEGNLRCLSRSDLQRISQKPSKRFIGNEQLSHVDHQDFDAFKKRLSPRWQAMYSAVESGQCSQRFAAGLLKLANLKDASTDLFPLEKYATQIAVHEVAAFASSEERRTQLRIKKTIPQALFSIWAQGIQSQPAPDMIRFFRDAYLNLSQSGLEHLGFYFIVFSKVTESQPAFETYLQTVPQDKRDLFKSFRTLSLKSSRTHLATALGARIDTILTLLKEAS